MSTPTCIDCGSKLKTETFHNEPWYTCKCGTAMPIERYDEMIKDIREWRRSKIGRVWNNPIYNQ